MSFIEEKYFVDVYIKGAVNIFASAIEAGSFDCSLSFETTHMGANEIIKNSSALANIMLRETAAVLGLESLADWKKKIENRNVCIEVTYEGEDTYHICFKLCFLEEMKAHKKMKVVWVMGM